MNPAATRRLAAEVTPARFRRAFGAGSQAVPASRQVRLVVLSLLAHAAWVAILLHFFSAGLSNRDNLRMVSPLPIELAKTQAPVVPPPPEVFPKISVEDPPPDQPPPDTPLPDRPRDHPTPPKPLQTPPPPKPIPRPHRDTPHEFPHPTPQPDPEPQPEPQPTPQPQPQPVPQPQPTPQPESQSHPEPATPVIVAPRVKDNPTPSYPRQARKRGYEGKVVLHVTVDAGGKVKSAEVKRSSGYSILDKAARNSVLDWTFFPGTRDGQKVESATDVTVRFELK